MTFSEQINGLFEREEWAEARRLLEQRLRDEPDNHWLLTRLGTTYYEQRDYKKALELTQNAYDLFKKPRPRPVCPLVLWDLASTLEMRGDRGDDLEALKIYWELIERGTKSVAEEECGEGMAWARALLTDCHYSAAGCLHRLDIPDEALWFILQFLKFRAMGIKSIYSFRDAGARLREIRARLRETAGSAGAVFDQEIEVEGKKLADVKSISSLRDLRAWLRETDGFGGAVLERAIKEAGKRLLKV